jgi:hypothetical protein
VTFEVKVDPTYGLPVGCPGLAKVGALDKTGVPAGDAVEASESPFLFVAFTVKV